MQSKESQSNKLTASSTVLILCLTRTDNWICACKQSTTDSEADPSRAVPLSPRKIKEEVKGRTAQKLNKSMGGLWPWLMQNLHR